MTRLPRVLRLTLVLAALATPGLASAQERPADPGAVLYEAARVLEADGNHELADALYDLILERYPSSLAAQMIREERSRPDARRLDSSGRTELVVWSTLYGFWLGVAVPGALGAEEPSAYGLGLLIGGPAALAISLNATREASVGEGDAELLTWGGSFGTWQGFGWAHVLDIGNDCDPDRPAGGFDYCSEGPSSEALFAMSILGGLSGTGVMAVAARDRVIHPGTSTMVSLGSLWGTWYGLSIAGMIEMDEDELLTSSLIGGIAGAGLTASMARTTPMSRSRARLASIAGVAGALAGYGMLLIAEPDDAAVFFGVPMVTGTLGLAIGLASFSDGNNTGSRDPGGADWELGGPPMPAWIDGPGGMSEPALKLPLLRIRF